MCGRGLIRGGRVLKRGVQKRSGRKGSKILFASLNSESSIIFDNNLNNNYIQSVLTEECSCILSVTILTVSITLTVTPFNLKVQVEALKQPASMNSVVDSCTKRT